MHVVFFGSGLLDCSFYFCDLVCFVSDWFGGFDLFFLCCVILLVVGLFLLIGGGYYGFLFSVCLSGLRCLFGLVCIGCCVLPFDLLFRFVF